MAKPNSGTGAPKSDASYAEPRLIPDYQLLGRDDSGGPEFQPYAGQFRGGGYVTGRPKKHLSARGGVEDPIAGDEQLSTGVARNKALGSGGGAASSRARAVSTK